MTNAFLSRRPWLKRGLVAFLALFSLYLCFGLWGVPAILKSQIAKHGSAALGRELSVERASFNPLTLEARLYDVRLAGPEGNSPTLELGRIAVNAQLSSVLPNRLELKAVEVSDGVARAAIEGNGQFDFQDILDHLAAAPAEEADPEAELMAARVQRLSLANLSFEFEDRSLASPYAESVKLVSLEGRNLGTVRKDSIEELDTLPNSPAYHWDFDAAVETQSGATLNLAGGAEAIDPWIFSMQAHFHDFPLASLQPYVDEAVRAQLDGLFGFDLTLMADLSASGSPQLRASGEVALADLALSDEEMRYFAGQSLALRGLDLDLSGAVFRVGEVVLESPFFQMALRESGELALPEMLAAEVEDEGVATAGADFTVQVEKVIVTNGELAFADRSLEQAFETRVGEVAITISEIEARQRDGALEASAQSQVAMRLLGGELSLAANLESLAAGGSAEMEFSALDLSQLQPYVAEHSLTRLGSGLLSGRGKAAFGEELAASGDIELRDLLVSSVVDGQEISRLAALKVEGVAYSADGVVVDLVRLEEPALSVEQDEEGITATRLMKTVAVEEAPEAGPEDETTAGAEADLPVLVKRLEIAAGSVDFLDSTMDKAFRSRIHDLEVSIENVSTSPGEIADLSFRALIDEGAAVDGTGRVDLSDAQALADLTVSFRGYDLSSTSPYWETYLGRNLAKGQFQIESTYQLRDSFLEGSNSFEIDQLTLGDRVESEEAINLPIGFAIKLMQNRSGLISYDGLNVSGDLSDPTVGIWGLVGKAVSNLIASAVTAPFKFLAGMVGGREDLDTIEFAVGQVSLSEVAREKAQALQRILAQRPGLTLEYAFNADEEAERAFLKERYVRHQLANPGVSVTNGLDLLAEVDEAAYAAALEARYLALLAAEAEEATGAEEAESEGGGSAGESPASATEKSSPAKAETVALEAEEDVHRGVFSRIARFFGFGSDRATSDEGSALAAGEAGEASRDEGDQATTESVEPIEETIAVASHAAMLDRVMQEYGAEVVQASWLQDLANERLRTVEAVLLADPGVEASRLTMVGADSLSGKKPAGSVVFELSE